MDLVTHKTSEVIDRHPDVAIIRQIIQSPLIRVAFEHGAWIAGGFARAVFLCKRMDQFFSSSGYIMPGDIDLFFDSQEAADAVITFYRNMGNVDKSYGGNAAQTIYRLSQPVARISGINSISIQVVNNPTLILPIREQLDRFDFTNVCCAFRDEEFLAPPNLLELESSYLLDIKNSSSPFLAARIRKYMRRGFAGVTDGSRQHITDWLINAVADGFKGVPGLNGTVKDADWCKAQISELLYKNELLLRNEDLVMLIGMFKRDVANGRYGDVFIVDDALEKIRIRSCKD
jgi:hypothetical protein